MRRRFWLVGLLVLGLLIGSYGFRQDKLKNPQERTGRASPLTRALWLLSGIDTAPLHVRVVDEISLQPIPGAGCVIPETNQRVETDDKGLAPVIRAPVLRDPRTDDLVAELHGELALICYKNGYRDAITTGIRMYDDTETQFEVFMTPIGPRDKRIEPTINNLAPHRLWQINLADRYRLFDAGEGRESPDLTRRGNMVTPQSPIRGGIQTPIMPGPGGRLETEELQNPPPRISPQQPGAQPPAGQPPAGQPPAGQPPAGQQPAGQQPAAPQR